MPACLRRGMMSLYLLTLRRKADSGILPCSRGIVATDTNVKGNLTAKLSHTRQNVCRSSGIRGKTYRLSNRAVIHYMNTRVQHWLPHSALYL
eukprot:5339008-Amphidinium_carterae.1